MKKTALLVTVWIFAGFLALLYETPAHATPIWGSDASGELTGGRTSYDTPNTDDNSGGVDATQQWDNGGFTIDWVIEQGANDLWTYTYTVTGETKGLSHFILEVTEDNNPFNIYGGTSTPYEGPEVWSSSDIDESSNPSNPLMPNPIYGVKFDFGSTMVTYTMITDRAPVYGVFYTKDGINKDDDNISFDVVAWSNALNFSDYKTNEEDLSITDFIVRPDGVPIPEPSTILLMGTSLLGIIGFSRKRLNKKA